MKRKSTCPTVFNCQVHTALVEAHQQTAAEWNINVTFANMDEQASKRRARKAEGDNRPKRQQVRLMLVADFSRGSTLALMRYARWGAPELPAAPGLHGVTGAPSAAQNRVAHLIVSECKSLSHTTCCVIYL